MHHMRALYQRAAGDAPAKAGDLMRFVASTGDVARDGLVINQDGWELDNYRANPVVLWCHAYGAWGDAESARPIGKCERVWVEDGALMADIRFNQNNEFAVGIEQDYLNGFLSAVSVGWDTKEFRPSDNPDMYGTATRSELLDISCVPVPGDPKALKRNQMRALRSLGREFLDLTGDDEDETPPANAAETDPTKDATGQRSTTPPNPAPESSARLTWPETAAAMARLFQPFSQRPDDERQETYKRLARDYQRHNKTAPEFLPADELEALTADDIRAHFLEGEPELHADLFAAMGSRAGAVLSKRNQDDLQSACDLIAGVLERAQKEAEQSAEDTARHFATRILNRLDAKRDAA